MVGVLRMLRLVRILRLGKVFHYLPELFAIVRGIRIAFRAIALVFALIGIFIYMAAIALRVLLADTNVGNLRFKSVPQAMATLLLDCVMSGGRGGPLMREVYSEHMICSFFLFGFSLLANVTMMGVLGALLVQVTQKVVEKGEEERSIMYSLATMDDFWKHVASRDEANDGFLTMNGFFELLSDEKTVKLLHKMTVDPETLIFLSDVVFSEHNDRMTQVEFNRFVLDLRESQNCRRKDHLVTRKFVNTRLTQLFHDFAHQSKTS